MSKKRNTEQEQAAQMAQHAQEVAAQPGTQEQQEELRELMQLPFSKIAKLPNDKQAKIWGEYARQLAEMASANAKAAQSVLEQFSRLREETAPKVDEAIRAIGKIADRTQDAIQEVFRNTSIRETIHTFAILEPYINAEYEEHPELYPLDTDEADKRIIAAAARRARADGKEIPRLRAEGDAEQLEMQLDFPTPGTGTPEAEASPAAILEGAKLAISPADAEASPASVLDAMRRLPQLQAILPKYHVSPNSRLANELNKLINMGEADLVVANRGKKNEITTLVSVSYDDKGVKLIGRQYTGFTREVYDAICSIWEYGHESHLFTPNMVYRAMTRAASDPSPQLKGAITKAIENARRIFADVDATEEVRAYLKHSGQEVPENTRYIYNDAILSIEKVEARNGKVIQGVYKIKSEPLLLSYSKVTKKLLTTPTDLLDIKELDGKGGITEISIANTESRIAIKGYLWRRVQVMKNDKKNKSPHCSNVILFDTVFSETDQTSENREILRRNRDYCFQVLDYWKARGYIRGYKKQTGEKRAITGVLIDLE